MPKPYVARWLRQELDAYRDEYEDGFALPPAGEEALTAAMSRVADDILAVAATGIVPVSLAADLDGFLPGESPEAKVKQLFQYRYVAERLEFAVASDVLGRLDDADQSHRISASILAFFVLCEANPSITAVKYLERAVRLFLAGYGSEVLIMCGAVMEAALRDRVPNEELLRSGKKPNRRTNDFPLKDRMDWEKSNPFLTNEQRDSFWKVYNWRCDAVHNQPDMGPDPSDAILETAFLLAVLLPKDVT